MGAGCIYQTHAFQMGERVRNYVQFSHKLFGLTNFYFTIKVVAQQFQAFFKKYKNLF